MHQCVNLRTISALLSVAVLLYCTYNTALLKSPKKYGLKLLIFGNFAHLRTFVLFFSTCICIKIKKNLKKILPSLGNFARVWVDMVIRQQSPTRHTAVRAGGGLPRSPSAGARFGTHVQVHAILLLKVGVRGFGRVPQTGKGPASHAARPLSPKKCCVLDTIACNASPIRGGRLARI